MRFALVLGVWTVILSLVSILFISRGETSSLAVKTPDKTQSEISIKITTTFSVEKDPFALDFEEKKPFIVKLDGNTLMEKSEGISDRIPLKIEGINLNSGEHEVLISANSSNSNKANAVRVEVFEYGNPLQEKTIWFEAGESINASLIFSSGSEHKDEHQH